MSIKKAVDGRGRQRFRVYVYDSSRSKSVYLGTFDREKDAREAEYEGRRRLRLGDPAKPKPPREQVSFETLGRRWLNSRANIRRATKTDYESCLRRLRPHFGGKLVSEISRKDVDLAVAELTKMYSPSTCRKTFVVFSMVMKAGVAWGHLDALPTYGQKLALPKVRRRRFEPLSVAQVNALVDAAPEYWKPAVLLLFTAAPRRAELFGMTIDCVDLEAGTITIRRQLQRGTLVEPKSDAAERKVPLPRATIDALREHMRCVPQTEMRLLFPTESGLPVDANNWFHRVWEPTRQKAGLPALRVHDARAHLASLLLSRGRSVKYVQRTLGHATASILLDVYAFVTKQEEQEAATDLERWLAGEKQSRYAA